MDNLFIYLLFGHLVGDYICQPKTMAVKKGANNWIAFNHVMIYTFCVSLFTSTYFIDSSWGWKFVIWALIIFFPHYLIDRYSLADKWLKLINGRSLEDFLENGHKDIPIIKPKTDYTKTDLKELEKNYDELYKWNNYHILRGGFTALVYTVTDNTMHLLCLWYGFKLLQLISN